MNWKHGIWELLSEYITGFQLEVYMNNLFVRKADELRRVEIYILSENQAALEREVYYYIWYTTNPEEGLG